MNYPLYLARRLSLSSTGGKSTPAVKVAVTAVALSIAVMIASIAIVFGFKREIRDKVIGFNSHITLYAVPQSEGDDNLVSLTPSLSRLLSEQDYITDFSVETTIPAIMKTSDNFKGVYLRSLNGAVTTDFLKSNLEEGKIPDFKNKKGGEEEIVISRIAARQLGLKAGDRIDTYFINDEVKARKLKVAGIFNSHFDSYDDVYIYGSIGLIQNLGKLSTTQGTTIQISTDDFNRIDEYTAALQASLDKALAEGLVYKYYKVENARLQGAGYFQWLNLLDTNVAVVLILMTFVSCVTLISGMLIIILDKKSFIGLICSMGARRSKVRMIFVYVAVRVALIGMVIGNALMLGLLWCQDKWHLIPLDAEAYYIDFVPVEFNWPAFALLNLGVLVVIYLALILPSWFVAKISPAETMRYE